MRFHDASPVWRQQATPKQRDSNAISRQLVPLGFPNVDGGAAPGLVGGVTVRGDQPASRDRASPRQRSQLSSREAGVPKNSRFSASPTSRSLLTLRSIRLGRLNASQLRKYLTRMLGALLCDPLWDTR